MRGLTNSWAATSRLDRPCCTSWATCSSVGVSSAPVPWSRLREVSPEALSSWAARSAHGAALRSSNVSRAARRCGARVDPPPLTPQVLAVGQLGARSLERADRVGVQGEGLLEPRSRLLVVTADGEHRSSVGRHRRRPRLSGGRRERLQVVDPEAGGLRLVGVHGGLDPVDARGPSDDRMADLGQVVERRRPGGRGVQALGPPGDVTQDHVEDAHGLLLQDLLDPLQLLVVGVVPAERREQQQGRERHRGQDRLAGALPEPQGLVLLGGRGRPATVGDVAERQPGQRVEDGHDRAGAAGLGQQALVVVVGGDGCRRGAARRCPGWAAARGRRGRGARRWRRPGAAWRRQRPSRPRRPHAGRGSARRSSAAAPTRPRGSVAKVAGSMSTPESPPKAAIAAATIAISRARSASWATTSRAPSRSSRCATLTEPVFHSTRARSRTTSASSSGSSAAARAASTSVASARRAAGEPGAPRGAEQPSRATGAVRAELGRALPGRGRRLVPAALLGPAGRGLEVGDHGGVGPVHGGGPVPGAAVGVVGVGQRIGQGRVHLAAVGAGGGGVQGGADERVPQLDHAAGDPHQTGTLGLGQGVRADAQSRPRRAPRWRGASSRRRQPPAAAAAHRATGDGPGRGRPARSSPVTGRRPGQARPTGQLVGESACGISTRASGLPPVLASSWAATSGLTSEPDRSRSSPVLAARSSPASGRLGRSPKSKVRTSVSRAAKSIATRSTSRRLATNSRAAADASSSQWASSTTTSTGCVSAASASRLSAARKTRNRSPAPSPVSMPNAARRAVRLPRREVTGERHQRPEQPLQGGEGEGRLRLDPLGPQHPHVRRGRGAARRRAARSCRCPGRPAPRVLRPGRTAQHRAAALSWPAPRRGHAARGDPTSGWSRRSDRR